MRNNEAGPSHCLNSRLCTATECHANHVASISRLVRPRSGLATSASPVRVNHGCSRLRTTSMPEPVTATGPRGSGQERSRLIRCSPMAYDAAGLRRSEHLSTPNPRPASRAGGRADENPPRPSPQAFPGRVRGRRGLNDGWPMTTSLHPQSVRVHSPAVLSGTGWYPVQFFSFADPVIERLSRSARDWVSELLWRLKLTYPPSR